MVLVLRVAPFQAGDLVCVWLASPASLLHCLLLHSSLARAAHGEICADN